MLHPWDRLLKIRAMFIYNTQASYQHPLSHFVYHAGIPLLSCWLSTAHQLPVLISAGRGCPRTFQTAARPPSRHSVNLFRAISHKSTGKLLPPYGLSQNQQIYLTFFFFHSTHGPSPYGTGRPYRSLVALSTTGGIAKWTTKSFQLAMRIVQLFIKENKPVHCLDSNSKLHFLTSQKYLTHLNATYFYYGTRISCQNGYVS